MTETSNEPGDGFLNMRSNEAYVVSGYVGQTVVTTTMIISTALYLILWIICIDRCMHSRDRMGIIIFL